MLSIDESQTTKFCKLKGQMLSMEVSNTKLSLTFEMLDAVTGGTRRRRRMRRRRSKFGGRGRRPGIRGEAAE